MKVDFYRRIELMREALLVVNSQDCWKEELCGLSVNAISRWAVASGLADESAIVVSLTRISRKLGFLATRSQVAIVDDKENVEIELEADMQKLKATLMEFGSSESSFE
ncbi:hypothetical protein FHS27_004079 [Rhodopirellula rubra]|uniref:Uncharacterized protein n=1 Tax=Aporhodopirellula rubra TaxID=980271 RepID=A0A7W5H677_9BACT|nr:hypothetical protein [Aporhodopirellula rubra]MBB3208252.1 hypothetical protein [Aporhodopirellula rubra]